MYAWWTHVHRAISRNLQESSSFCQQVTHPTSIEDAVHIEGPYEEYYSSEDGWSGSVQGDSYALNMGWVDMDF